MNFLFLCTGNSCRSILSEALFNAKAPSGFQAFSAGSHPSGVVHPLSIKALHNRGLSTDALFSKSISECDQYPIDVVITVCSDAANQACPIYLGKAIKAHWGLEDPSHLDLPETEKLAAFERTIDIIHQRLDVLFANDLNALSQDEFTTLLTRIAKVGS